LCEHDQLLQEEHEDVHEVQVLDVALDFFIIGIWLFNNNIRVVDGKITKFINS